MKLFLLAAAVLVVVVISGPTEIATFKGTYRDVGLQEGKRFKADIQERMSWSDIEFLSKLLNTTEGQNIYNTFYTTSNHHFPQYLDQLNGMADGAGVDRKLLFMVNIQNEIDIIKPHVNRIKTRTCCDIMTKAGPQRHWGHNEDGDEKFRGIDSLRHYEIYDGHSKNLRENFTSYVYAGMLPGNAFGWNNVLALSTNALFPTYIYMKGLPRIFLNRHMYSAKSFEEAVAMCHAPPLASGFAGNIVALFDRRMVTTEVAPSGVHDQKETPEGAYHFHMNNYLWMKIKSRNDTSSFYRLKRAKQMPVPKSWQGIADILGDTKNKQWPIYRNGAPPDTGVVTLASYHVDVDNAMAYIYYTNPKTGKPAASFRLK